MVQVRIAGKIPRVKKIPNQPEIFIGMYRVEQTKAELSRLGDMDPYYFTDEFECVLDKSDGAWGHADKCPSNFHEVGPSWTCPYEDHLRDRKYLSRLESRPFLHILFCNPALAAEHESMDEQELLTNYG